MKKFTLTLLSIFLVSITYSQSAYSGWQPGLIGVPNSGEGYKKYKKITGTPHLNNEFVEGTINDENGNFQKALLRYNAISEIVEVIIQDKKHMDIRVLPKVKEISYTLEDYSLIFDSFPTNNDEILEGYFIEFYKGESYSLYGDPYPKVGAEKISRGYEKSVHLSVEIDYYLKKNNGVLQQVKLKDKDFKKLLPNSPALDQYLNENELKSPQDYAALLMWLENQDNI